MIWLFETHGHNMLRSPSRKRSGIALRSSLLSAIIRDEDYLEITIDSRIIHFKLQRAYSGIYGLRSVFDELCPPLAGDDWRLGSCCKLWTHNAVNKINT